MKKSIIFVLTIFLFVSFIGCENPTGTNEANDSLEEFFSGEHKIQKMKNFSGISGNSKIESRFFRLSSSSYFEEDLYIYFSWESENGDFILSKFPYTSIKVVLNENRENPVAEFNYYLFDFDSPDFESTIFVPGGYTNQGSDIRCSYFNANKEILLNDPIFINKIIHSLAIECHPDDWVMDVEMPFKFSE